MPEAERFEDLLECDVLVDAIFGIGLSRNIEGEYAHMIEPVSYTHLDVYKRQHIQSF